MNSLTEKYINSVYEIVAPLSGNVTLVRSKKTGRLLVRKLTAAEGAEVYRIAAGINVRGLPKILSVEEEDGRLAVIYEYVQGMSVKEYVEKNGAMAPDAVNSYITDICGALTALHKRGIVHRDITAANTVIGTDGICYIIDLGIARVAKKEKNADTAILGTAGFAAPEQFGFRQTDARADIYSVGVLMHYMLTGAMPNEREAAERINDVSKKCMELDPKNRYASAKELKEAIAKKRMPINKLRMVSAILLAMVFVFMIPGFFGNDSGYVKLKVFFSYLFIMFVPIAALTDLFGIIGRLAGKYEWRMPERIGIRVFIILSVIFLVPVIDKIIQAV